MILNALSENEKYTFSKVFLLVTSKLNIQRHRERMFNFVFYPFIIWFQEARDSTRTSKMWVSPLNKIIHNSSYPWSHLLFRQRYVLMLERWEFTITPWQRKRPSSFPEYIVFSSSSSPQHHRNTQRMKGICKNHRFLQNMRYKSTAMNPKPLFGSICQLRRQKTLKNRTNLRSQKNGSAWGERVVWFWHYE